MQKAQIAAVSGHGVTRPIDHESRETWPAPLVVDLAWGRVPGEISRAMLHEVSRLSSKERCRESRIKLDVLQRFRVAVAAEFFADDALVDESGAVCVAPGSVNPMILHQLRQRYIDGIAKHARDEHLVGLILKEERAQGLEESIAAWEDYKEQISRAFELRELAVQNGLVPAAERYGHESDAGEGLRGARGRTL